MVSIFLFFNLPPLEALLSDNSPQEEGEKEDMSIVSFS